MTVPAPDGGIYVRMDERQFRFAVQSGARDAYVVSGWRSLAHTDFEAALAVLKDAGVAVEMGDAAHCNLRCAQQVAAFSDPSGNRHELVWGFRSDFAHFASPMRRVALCHRQHWHGNTPYCPPPILRRQSEFVTKVMGFGLSDIYNFQPLAMADAADPLLPLQQRSPPQLGAGRVSGAQRLCPRHGRSRKHARSWPRDGPAWPRTRCRRP